MINELTDDTIQGLLVAVGADPGVDPSDFDTSFDDLDLDSLARTEFAYRVHELTGVDVEEHIGAATTPNAVRRMVRTRPSERLES